MQFCKCLLCDIGKSEEPRQPLMVDLQQEQDFGTAETIAKLLLWRLLLLLLLLLAAIALIPCSSLLQIEIQRGPICAETL